MVKTECVCPNCGTIWESVVDERQALNGIRRAGFLIIPCLDCNTATQGEAHE